VKPDDHVPRIAAHAAVLDILLNVAAARVQDEPNLLVAVGASNVRFVSHVLLGLVQQQPPGYLQAIVNMYGCNGDATGRGARARPRGTRPPGRTEVVPTGGRMSQRDNRIPLAAPVLPETRYQPRDREYSVSK
jgi:hypothetical protein